MSSDRVKLTTEKWIAVSAANVALIAIFYLLLVKNGYDIFHDSIETVGLFNLLPLYVIAGITNTLIFYSRLGEK
jgi:hypothetical protein